MAYGLYDRVWEVLIITGTGTISTGTTGAPGGYLPISAAAATGDLVPYVIVDKTTGDWEVGAGTFTSGSPSTLSRLYVFKSSASGALMNFAGNQCDVFIDSNSEIDKSAHFGLASGRWYGVYNAIPFANVAPDAGTIDYMPLFLGKPHLYQQVAVQVETAPSASTQLRLGFYADAGGGPGNLIWDAGTITITAAGLNAISLAGAPPLFGRIWGAIGGPSTVNGMGLAGYGQYNNPIYAAEMGTYESGFFSSNSGSSNIVGATQTGFTFGALPASAAPSIRDQSAIAAMVVQA